MHSIKLVLFLCISAIAFNVAAAAKAQTNPVMMRRNAENTLGSLGANRAKSMMSQIDRIGDRAEQDGSTAIDPASVQAMRFGDGAQAQPIGFHTYPGAGAVDIWVGGAYSDYKSRYGVIDSEGFVGLVQGGVDVRLSSSVLVGVMALGDLTESDTDNMMVGFGPVETTSQGFLAGPYVVLGLGDSIHLEGLAAVGQVYNDYTWIGVPEMDYDSDRLLLAARLSDDWRSGDWGLRHEARVTYYAEKQEAFTDAAGNAIDEKTNILGQVRLGSELSHDFHLDGGLISPFAGVEGVWAYRSDELRMAGQPVSQDDLSASFSLGLDAQLGRSTIRLSGHHDGVGADDFQATGGEVQLRIPLN